MATGSSNPLLRFIRTITAAQRTGELTDGQLLEHFVTQRDEAAFTALLHRHGPMVLGVCRSVLNDVDDAEDVFQATFLVLVRKPGAIAKRESVGSWLHGVAYRLARKARADAARRRRHERRAATMATTEPGDEVIWNDLRPILHEEVNRLPEKYRTPFILCYLEGKTNEEAARLLGWPKGTVLSSLSRARERLRQRLTRRGLALSAAALATVLSQNTLSAAVPPVLAQATLRAALLVAAGSATAAGALSGPVLALVETAVQAMVVTKLKLTAAVLLALGLAGAAAGVVAYRTGAVASGPANETYPLAQTSQAADRPRPDRELLQGEWKVIAGEQHGLQVDEVGEDRLVFTGDGFTWMAWRGEVARIFRRGETSGTFRLDLTARPKRIDLVDTNPSGARTLEGIYRLEGDRLMICLGDPAIGERPLEFATRPDDRRMLWLFERQSVKGPIDHEKNGRDG